MSGGHFDYAQYYIDEIRESMQHELDKQRNTEAVQKILRDGVRALQIAHTYTHRLDWFLSGDDSEETMISKLKKDLTKLPNILL